MGAFSFSHMTAEKKRMLFFGIVIVFLAFLLFRQYMPTIQLPTNSRIAEEEKRLESKLGDLEVQKKMNEDFQKEVAEVRQRMTMFWMRNHVGIPLEQEVLDEFNSVARLSGVNIQNKEAKLVKNNNSTFVQEVEIRLEMRGISMKELTRLMRQISTNRRRFHWYYCRIEPDNPQRPSGVKVSARLRAFVLTDDGSALLANGADALASDTTANGGPSRNSTKKSTSRPKTKGK